MWAHSCLLVSEATAYGTSEAWPQTRLPLAYAQFSCLLMFPLSYAKEVSHQIS